MGKDIPAFIIHIFFFLKKCYFDLNFHYFDFFLFFGRMDKNVFFCFVQKAGNIRKNLLPPALFTLKNSGFFPAGKSGKTHVSSLR